MKHLHSLSHHLSNLSHHPSFPSRHPSFPSRHPSESWDLTPPPGIPAFAGMTNSMGISILSFFLLNIISR